jgi:hypothetical protein
MARELPSNTALFRAGRPPAEGRLSPPAGLKVLPVAAARGWRPAPGVPCPRTRHPALRQAGGQVLVAAERNDRADGDSADESGESGGQDVLPSCGNPPAGCSAATGSLT